MKLLGNILTDIAMVTPYRGRQEFAQTADRQTDRQMDRQIRQIDRQLDRQTDR